MLEPGEVPLKEGIIDTRGEVLDLAEVVEPQVDGVATAGVEPRPECASQDGHRVRDVVACAVEGDEASEGLLRSSTFVHRLPFEGEVGESAVGLFLC